MFWTGLDSRKMVSTFICFNWRARNNAFLYYHHIHIKKFQCVVCVHYWKTWPVECSIVKQTNLPIWFETCEIRLSIIFGIFLFSHFRMCGCYVDIITPYFPNRITMGENAQRHVCTHCLWWWWLVCRVYGVWLKLIYSKDVLLLKKNNIFVTDSSTDMFLSH